MFSKYAAGKKVYSQGSFAPTRGQVDPKGYIEREVRNRAKQNSVSKVGNDGKSDTRSGLASRALKAKGNGGFTLPKSSFAPPANAPGPPPVGTPQVPMAAPAPPSISISPTGQLQLPYSSEFAGQQLQAQQAFDSQLLELQMAEQQQARMYQESSRNLDKGYDTQKLGTLNNSSGRGVLRSSAHSTAVTNDATNYLTNKNSLDGQNNEFKSSVTAQKSAAQTALQQILQQIQQAQAEELAKSAGALGLDGSNPAETAPAPSNPTSSPYAIQQQQVAVAKAMKDKAAQAALEDKKDKDKKKNKKGKK